MTKFSQCIIMTSNKGIWREQNFYCSLFSSSHFLFSPLSKKDVCLGNQGKWLVNVIRTKTMIILMITSSINDWGFMNTYNFIPWQEESSVGGD